MCQMRIIFFKYWYVLNISFWILGATAFGGDITSPSHKAQVRDLLLYPGVGCWTQDPTFPKTPEPPKSPDKG